MKLFIVGTFMHLPLYVLLVLMVRCKICTLLLFYNVKNSEFQDTSGYWGFR